MLICVTNSSLCQQNLLSRIRQLAEARPYAILLREKDLEAAAYEELAWQAKAICEPLDVRLILHQHREVARKLKHRYLQVSMPALRDYGQEDDFFVLGASIHSVAEAAEAERLGAAYVIAGHIFATDCKLGLSPRGVSFLQQVCQAVAIPVFAIGGINSRNVEAVLAGGAKGACVMSEAMACSDPRTFVKEFHNKIGL